MILNASSLALSLLTHILDNKFQCLHQNFRVDLKLLPLKGLKTKQKAAKTCLQEVCHLCRKRLNAQSVTQAGFELPILLHLID